MIVKNNAKLKQSEKKNIAYLKRILAEKVQYTFLKRYFEMQLVNNKIKKLRSQSYCIYFKLCILLIKTLKFKKKNYHTSKYLF